MSGFQRLNTRAAKITGEGVMWVRARYAEMWSYPRIRMGLQEHFGIVLSIQQITRIAKGESFAQLPVMPTDREVDLTMRLNALGATPPSEKAINESLSRFQAQLAQEASQPRESVLEIMENRLKQRVPSLEEIEARERAALGVQEGAGLEKLKAVSQPAINAANLLETLSNGNDNSTD